MPQEVRGTVAASGVEVAGRAVAEPIVGTGARDTGGVDIDVDLIAARVVARVGAHHVMAPDVKDPHIVGARGELAGVHPYDLALSLQQFEAILEPI